MELKNLGQTAASALIHTDIRLEREHWTMFRQKLLGIAAAATLGSAAMLGPTAAYAVKICDSSIDSRAALTEEGGDCFDSVIFAAETLLMGAANVTAASDEADTTAYYNIGDELFLGVPTDIGANSGDTYMVTVRLDGMVFTGAAALSGTTSATFSLALGGGAGDNLAVFRLTGGTLSATDGALSLDADYAVSAAGGSATLTIRNRTLAELEIEGVDGTATRSGNSIMVAGALNETAIAMNPTADVGADGFMMFEAGRTTASLGTLEVGVKAMHRRAQTDGTDDAGALVADLEDIMLTGNNTETPPAPNSSVAFSGDFSFASKVFLHGDGDCGALATDAHVATPNSDTDEATAETDLRMMEGEDDAAVILGTTSAVDVSDFATPQTLCVMVDPEAEDPMRIPATKAYTAMGSYMGITDAAIDPMPEEQTLGMIERNGTTVRLPSLSTHDRFNQRIRVVNRGPDAEYEMEFHGTDDEAGMDAAGTLAADSITVLSLRTDDVVKVGSGNSTSATLIVEALPNMIDVATVQTNRATGNTDTVVYSAD